MRDLKANENILIQKADKCSTLCILNKTNYDSEGLRQLENSTYYEQINESNIDEITKVVNDIIENVYKGRQLDEVTYNYLIQNLHCQKLGKFFLLPKIHKIPKKYL